MFEKYFFRFALKAYLDINNEKIDNEEHLIVLLLGRTTVKSL
jgi:hypothetical protein